MPLSDRTAATAPASPDPAGPVPTRRRRWPGVLLTLAVLLAALAVAGYAFLGTQTALDWVLQRAVAETQGRLSIDGARGSLLSTVQVGRITWRGDDVDVEAEAIALTWSPTALLSRRIAVSGLGAKRIALFIKPTPTGGPPASLALPVDVEVRNVGVERLEWRDSTSSGAVTGIAFDYAGGAKAHRVRNLSFVTTSGTLTGEIGLDTLPPFAARGALAFAGDGDLREFTAQATLSGVLEQLGVDLRGRWHDADLRLQATVTPFAASMFSSAELNAQDVDLARFMPELPRSRLALTATAAPAGTGIAGSLTARNESPGPLDGGGIPIVALETRYAYAEDRVDLNGLSAQLAGGGAASGRARLPLDGKPLEFELALRDVDLLRLQSSLVATRLSGTLSARVSEARQTVRGELRQADMGLSFAATIADRRVVVERFRAETGGGQLAGSGMLELDGPRKFTVDARAQGFDPARFASLPAGKIDGTIAARGVLEPAWDVSADVSVSPGSRFAEVAVAGTLRAAATAERVRDIEAAISIASAKATVSGAYGSGDDTLAFALDVQKLADFRKLLARHAGLPPDDPLAGSLRARGTVRGVAEGAGLDATLSGNGLQWGHSIAARTLAGTVRVSRASPERNAAEFSSRPVEISLNVADGRIATVGFKSLQGQVGGTLARHTGSFAAEGAEFDFAARFSGGVAERRGDGGGLESAWTGTLDTLSNRGNYALELMAPATVELAAGRVRVGSARVTVAEGRAELAELAIDEGRISTRGSFTAIPASAIARLAGNRLPFASTLELGGDWSLAASPRLNGTVRIRRERGDGYAGESTLLDPSELALGISVFDVNVQFVDDAVAANARFVSTRFGNADLQATLAAGQAPGRLSTDAPIEASLTASMPSLRPLQPWLGTLAAMDGRVSADLKAQGTLADPLLAGQLNGENLRFDLPQYGVHLRDGRLRARLADRTVNLEEFSFSGGGGTFSANGTLVRAGATGTASVDWRAKDFTLVNRPDLRIVADGTGKIAVADGKLTLDGNITLDEGRVIYAATTSGRLSDDVVIVGRPPAPTANGGSAGLPLKLDVEVALGRDFRFSGEGLETRLAGKVRVTTAANGTLTAKGAIRAVDGTYFVFGQRLVIDRGRLIFDGPADNPALDIVALRKNLAVEAGVEVTGTVKVPRVRLVSNPPVPDGEKLSWLITGQGVDRASGAEMAALSAASASLLGQGKKPITTTLANSIGLDDISVRSSSTAGATSGTNTQVIAFGKRITDRLSLVYEQGLTVANNALRLEYRLSRFVTLRAEAGVVSSMGIYFRRSYD